VDWVPNAIEVSSKETLGAGLVRGTVGNIIGLGFDMAMLSGAMRFELESGTLFG
jgi:hypothetical protein